MRINKPLRFLVVTGAFLSASAGLAQNSFSTEQVLVVSNTLKAQLLSSDRVSADLEVASSTTGAETRVGAAAPLEHRQLGFDRPQSTQSSLFMSDVATLDRDRRISGVPTPNPSETAIEIPVPSYLQSTASISIPVPLPRTQFIKVQPVARLPRVTRTSLIPSVSALPTVRSGTSSVPLAQQQSFATNATTAASSDLIYPLMTPARISSRFGWRTHPLTGTRRFHSGIDIAAPTGTPVVATGSGTVVSAGWNGGYGKAIIIQHNDVQQTLYGHLSQISVQPGQVIEQGTVIGLVGSTGNSTGPHLHFETRMPNGNTWVAIDPSEDIQYAVDNLRRSMPFARKDLPQGL
ncbi:M23 family metallopeptidase [Chamaesiphon sp.]|uniref:M23 family metallopeptidase n=1 Tax=Chamaesiphon sp. TaxID=2814140 RepID=UPI0035932007